MSKYFLEDVLSFWPQDGAIKIVVDVIQPAATKCLFCQKKKRERKENKKDKSLLTTKSRMAIIFCIKHERRKRKQAKVSRNHKLTTGRV